MDGVVIRVHLKMFRVHRPVLALILAFWVMSTLVFVSQMKRLERWEHSEQRVVRSLTQIEVIPGISTTNAPQELQKPRIRIAMICCGYRVLETLVLIKSALIFSQHASLEAFVISDKACLTQLSQGVENMTRHWSSSFAIKILPHYYPYDTENWKVPEQWMCSTNRLFLPTILPDKDSVLYLDSDVMIVSNMTEIWEYFETELRKKEYAVASLANHIPPPVEYWYAMRNIPYFGNGGINSGVIFMNLTRMRTFRFEELAIKTYRGYEGKLDGGPDQDILNLIFGTHKDNGTIMECNYNFNPEHCAYGEHYCKARVSDIRDDPTCFCNRTLTDGVKIVHAFGRHFLGGKLLFLQQLFEAFFQITLGSSNVLDVIRKLKEDFSTLPDRPFCFLLTAQAMYKNAEKYLRRLSSLGSI